MADETPKEKKKQSIVIKRKRGGEHGGAHGGAWKVAYADFVTAMMCFFLVMWLMGADEETKAAVAAYFTNPMAAHEAGGDPASQMPQPVGPQIGSNDSLLSGQRGLNPDSPTEKPVPNDQGNLKANKELAEMIQEIFGGQVFSVDVSIDYMKFSIPESVLFKPRSTTLTAQAPALLDRLGRILGNYPGNMTIESFTDKPPEINSAFTSSYEFSMAQSVKVMNYFVDRKWINEDRMFPRGGGARNRLTAGATAAAIEAQKNRNRRIEFTLTPKK